MNLGMNPTTGLKLSATCFTVFWTAGMVWCETREPASVIITVIGGIIAGYLWYRMMRWLLGVRQVPSETPSGQHSRKTAVVLSMSPDRRGDVADKQSQATTTPGNDEAKQRRRQATMTRMPRSAE
jgi:hypothetical protein